MKTKAPVVLDLTIDPADPPTLTLGQARVKPTFCEDPRYIELRKRYGADLCAFTEEMCGIELDPETSQAYRKASDPGTRMVLSDVFNMSEARLAAVALWAMLFHPRNEVAVIASRREAHKRHWTLYRQAISGTHCWLGEYLRITQEGVRTAAGYAGPRVSFRTAINHSPENLAGMCGSQMLFLVEGAAALGDNCMQVLRASIREPVVAEVLALSCFTVVQTSDKAA
ncbi:hypothetical protein HZF02_32820 (plasmid) [Pseudomonas yamanorum]|nr:hypothetical protein HZF02_32820 [Pseudomonas yamanorum]